MTKDDRNVAVAAASLGAVLAMTNPAAAALPTGIERPIDRVSQIRSELLKSLKGAKGDPRATVLVQWSNWRKF